MPLPKKIKRAADAALNEITHETNQNSDIGTANIADFLFDANEILPPEQVIISIQGKTVGSVGNSVVITGKPKSRKSVVAHSIAASAISGNPVLGIEAVLTSQNDKVVLIDTEQAKHDLHKSLNRMKELAGVSTMPDNLLVFSFRKLDAVGIKQGIEQILNLYPDVRLIIIDGGLDLINNMNDVPESKETIDYIKKILDAKNVCMVMIIHQSKSTNFTIGHFGSFMDRFSQTVIEVTKLENGNSQIKPQVMRSDADFRPYEIYWNFNINNYSVNWTEPNEFIAKYPSDLSEAQHELILKQAFSNNQFMSYENLIKSLARCYQKSESWAKKAIKHLSEINLINKSEQGIYIVDNTPNF
jgi:hypothetical protein